MIKYNKYINNFANEAEYEVYIDSSIAEVPNTALIDDTGKMIYAKILPNNYVMFGKTKGTQDFKIGGNSIQIHVAVEDDSGINKMYISPEDVLKTVTSFENIFNNTEGHKIVSISKWKIDTSQVTNMYCMFDGCSSLKSIDLSNFDTSNVNNIGCIFYGCSSLTSVDLSNFNTSKATNMDSMFSGCSSLKSLYLRNFDTSKVLGMSSMFLSCSDLNKLYLSGGFFNSKSLTTYEFNYLYNWTDTESLAMFVEAITSHDGTGKTVELTSSTKNALTTEQKTAITNAGWTIE